MLAREGPMCNDTQRGRYVEECVGELKTIAIKVQNSDIFCQHLGVRYISAPLYNLWDVKP